VADHQRRGRGSGLKTHAITEKGSTPKSMSAKGDSTEKLKGVQISSLDEDDEVEEVVEEEEEEEEGDDSEEEEEPVTLGFLEKTKNCWSLLRQVFPSKAGGVPVLIFQLFKTPFLSLILFYLSAI
jgi:hypothetical protein